MSRAFSCPWTVSSGHEFKSAGSVSVHWRIRMHRTRAAARSRGRRARPWDVEGDADRLAVAEAVVGGGARPRAAGRPASARAGCPSPSARRCRSSRGMPSASGGRTSTCSGRTPRITSAAARRRARRRRSRRAARWRRPCAKACRRRGRRRSALEQGHRRRADEAGDEEVRRACCRWSCGSASCWM